MSRFAKYYLLIFVLVGLAALLPLDETAMIGMLMLTLGLGVVALFAPTAFPYFLIFLPAALAKTTSSRALLGGIGLLVAGAWASMPYYLSSRQAESMAASLLTKDHAIAMPAGMDTFEVWRLPLANVNDALCADYCRGLLLGGGAKWVRVRAPVGQGSSLSGDGFFAGASGADCMVPGFPPPSDGRCIRRVADPGEAAKVLVRIQNAWGNSEGARGGGWQAQLRGERVATISLDGKEIARQTEATVGINIPGTLIWVSSGRYVFEKMNAAFNPIDVSSLLRKTGYRIAEVAVEQPQQVRVKRRGRKEWRDLPTAAETLDVISQLDRQGGFDRPTGMVVQNWLWKARHYQDWPADRIALMAKVVGDRRVKLVYFDDILATYPAVAGALIPVILSRLDPAPTDPYDNVGALGASALKRVDLKLLKPHTERITGIMARGGKPAQWLQPVAERLGIMIRTSSTRKK